MDGSRMSKFRKREIVEAYQWNKHGDVSNVTYIPLDQKVSESRRDKIGWMDTPEGGHIIFPGDWIIVDSRGRVSSCNPITFTKLYEAVEPMLPFRDQGRSA